MGSQVVCVAMQPTYLPWLGYFDLIDQSTVFVFLDNVQFAKRSWQQRNKIRTHNGLQWLTVPVRVKGKRDQLISQVEIVNSAAFPNSHLRAIEQAYSKSTFFRNYFPQFKELLTAGDPLLHKLNINMIRWLAYEFGIKTRFELSSELGAKGKRSELLADICGRVGANVYLSPVGSADYLIAEFQALRDRNVEVLFQSFLHPMYRQVYQPFMPQASAIDLLFNMGRESLEIIRNGRRPALTLCEMIEQTVVRNALLCKARPATGNGNEP